MKKKKKRNYEIQKKIILAKNVKSINTNAKLVRISIKS